MTKGFITISTGKEQYYKIAANLVKSYRYFAEKPLPFAVIAEEHNKYTEIFDDVIITKESTHSFMDKFLLLKLCPYDETIFLDADMLAFGDINRYFDLFKDATDFSSIGENFGLHENGAWYNVENIWKYGEMITYKSRMHAGVIFIRKSDKLKKMYDDCIDIYSNYDKLHFHICPQSYDEATFGVAMPMNNMRSVPEDPTLMAFLPCLKSLNENMLKKKLSYDLDWAGHIEKGALLHYGTRQTNGPIYKFDLKCLEILCENRELTLTEKLLYQYKIKLYLGKTKYNIIRFFRRVINKLLRQHKDI